MNNPTWLTGEEKQMPYSICKRIAWSVWATIKRKMRSYSGVKVNPCINSLAVRTISNALIIHDPPTAPAYDVHLRSITKKEEMQNTPRISLSYRRRDAETVPETELSIAETHTTMHKHHISSAHGAVQRYKKISASQNLEEHKRSHKHFIARPLLPFQNK